jgi:hypothetical protein
VADDGGHNKGLTGFEKITGSLGNGTHGSGSFDLVFGDNSTQQSL